MNVEKNIPIPPDIRNGGHGKRKYPFNVMEVGDSFLAPIKEGKRASDVINALTAAAHAFTKSQFGNPKFRIACRALPEGVRVWRIEDKT